jgi:hypothetical protein
LTAKAKTYLQPFFDWFGDWTDPEAIDVSKAVDENGEPKVLWHGTYDNFSEFDYTKPSRYGKHKVHLANGYFFTDRKDKAEKYGSVQIPVFLNMRNPGNTSVYDKGVVDNTSDENKVMNDPKYDSAIMIRYDKEGDNHGFTPTTQWFIKTANQVKSIDNQGTFSTTDNNINRNRQDQKAPPSDLGLK